MVVKITVRGIQQTKRFLKNKSKQTIILTSIGLGRAALFMQGEVKDSIAGRRAEPTSVDTGHFLNNVDFSVGKDQAVVFSQVEYAKILEFGGVNRRPRKHFNNSLARNKPNIRAIINKEIKKI